MDNSPEHHSIEKENSQQVLEWVKEILQEAKNKASSYKRVTPGLETLQRQDFFDNEILRTCFELSWSSFPSEKGKHNFNPISRMEKLGEELMKENNPLGIALKMAGAKNLRELEKTVLEIPDTLDFSFLKSKAKLLLTNGGKITFPNIKSPNSYPINAVIDTENFNITFKQERINPKITNLYIINNTFFQKVSAMLRPNK